MNIITSLLNNLNYPTIFFLMMLESTVIPVPSELVVSPAAYHAAGGNLSMWLVVLFATLGADLGATINYVVAYYVGRPVIYRFANSRIGHMCLLNQEKVEKSEKYFDDHGKLATITGRLIPGIRHLISKSRAKVHNTPSLRTDSGPIPDYIIKSWRYKIIYLRSFARSTYSYSLSKNTLA